MKPTIPLDLLRARHDALPPLAEFPGEREWVDRVRTFDEFLRLGPKMIESFDGLDTEEVGRRRQMAPELYELLREAFGSKPKRR